MLPAIDGHLESVYSDILFNGSQEDGSEKRVPSPGTRGGVFELSVDGVEGKKEAVVKLVKVHCSPPLLFSLGVSRLPLVSGAYCQEL